MTLTPGGWITMILSVGFVTTLFIWCISKVLRDKKTETHIHGIEDIDKGED
ncbi:MAG TPA: hypothetical protein VKA67_05390 [Verrucomicrobiae bacterium]|nr:hypothetical protein [Verrucomicrobiae bacterium]